MKDKLGDRMKSYYEDRTRYSLTRRTYTIIRLDGKAFHTYTQGLQRPFDDKLMFDMDDTAEFVCKNVQGAKMAFVQSDEISILLTDFDNLQTDAWFDGNIQKIVSVSASYATAKFNELRPGKLAFFDARVFQIPNRTEVENYFIWRQQDTARNSIQSVAQCMYSQKELHGKNTNELQELIFQKGTNWNDFAPRYKRGRVTRKETFSIGDAAHSQWYTGNCPIFTQEREFLNALIPAESGQDSQIGNKASNREVFAQQQSGENIHPAIIARSESHPVPKYHASLDAAEALNEQTNSSAGINWIDPKECVPDETGFYFGKYGDKITKVFYHALLKKWYAKTALLPHC